MQKIIFIIALLLTAGYINAQQIPPGSCGLLYKYDAAGNRISSEYFCNATGSPIDMRTAVNPAKDQAAPTDEASFVKVDVLFPNPTTGRFTVRFAKPLNNTPILITDATGRTIRQLTGNGYSLEFDISGQAAGTYYIVIRNGKDNLVQKVIKQ
ncbi:T9SS C-terminal target domain-containing protein [Paraflavitalea soli]|uniref:T9SS C-terminal target domain-containing protein n=1 Tax=Paraflavitalea soli TaxID=2315862 RepID=A0A3B7MME6_9BACT|nr:T9SS type A sorting domain-containing protein [Paraflavitalea soli]AXY74220.1 T9SS C-terminal target domain-containing protein [Paraflavitalea soli]